MALTRQQVVFTYNSASGGETYTFDIVVDAQGLISAKNILGPRGPISPTDTIPSSVLDDINTAKDTVNQVISETVVDTGTVIFTGQTSQAATVAAGVLNNTNYRVVYTTPDGTVLQTTGKTTTGFTAVAPTTYGSVAVPVTVSYEVLVATQQASTLGGTITITDADGGEVAVVFTTAMTSTNYRVVLTPNGFFTTRIINQLTTGFTVQIGYLLGAGESVTVGYDVFVN